MGCKALMELSEFAAQVLFSDNLEAKLERPAKLVDTDPGKGLSRKIAAPARPPQLAFGRAKQPAFPKKQDFKDPMVRAAVLHYFANHELLALELMSLALLKFNQAPAGFRSGIGQTMVEEINHLGLYRARMQQLGLEFGDIPVSQFFWNVMAGMRSPLEYCAQMSLTFEQANLDYSLHYQKLFEEHGDFESAQIMAQVYEEEIGHVKHGAVWFDRFRPKLDSHWHEFSAALEPPLTPRRARGIGFDRAGRQRAGLPSDSIDRLAVYNASKGRPGNLYWFNPDCEKQIGYGQKGGPANRYLQAFVADYAPVMMFLAQSDDTLLIPRMPPVGFLKSWMKLGFPLPELVECQSGVGPTKMVKGRRFNAFCPWGWEPNSLAMRVLMAKRLHCTKPSWAEVNPDQVRSSALGQAFSKGHAAHLRWKFCADEAGSLPVTDSRLEAVCTQTEQALMAIRSLQKQGLQACIKGFFGSSGRNSLRLRPEETISTNAQDWVARNCRSQGGVVVEPWYHRVLDFGVQIDTRRPKQPLLGFTRFFTSVRGQHKGHILGDPWWGLGPETKRFLHNDCQWQAAMLRLAQTVSDSLRELNYFGPAGIDGFVGKDLADENALRLRPLVEINPRHTMGHVALALQRRLCKGREPALWWHVSASELPDFGVESFSELWRKIGSHTEVPPLATNPVEQAVASLGLVLRGERDCRYWLETFNGETMFNG